MSKEQLPGCVGNARFHVTVFVFATFVIRKVKHLEALKHTVMANASFNSIMETKVRTVRLMVQNGAQKKFVTSCL